MKIPRFYRGKFNPLVDIPVNPENQALTLEKFSKLPMAIQQDILAKGHLLGDPGVANPDIDFVPPMCRKGVTMAQLMKLYKQTDETIKHGIANKKRDAIVRKQLEAASDVQSANPQTN